MALDERQTKCIELLGEGTLKISEIAKLCGVSRQTIYNWRQEEEFKTTLDRRLSVVKTEANEKINSALPSVVDELLRLALCDDTPTREKVNCLQYICNRVLGSPISSANIEINDKTDTQNTDALAEFNAFIAEQEGKCAENEAE
ncbi:phBC6A51 family helix-turn-helix protein [Enterococcus sp.]|uniref:phBC6A51 family helix-turn-helix protein n=1 Tax=Enterococcus sp. TaxID=35783 RepID=UPI00289D3F74|nr:phBC6A51 family helix-turn-helix protein [Enterococcus sp.]